MTETTLPENSYDIVVAVEVLEHVVKDGQFIRNVYRVLRPGGFFLMTTPNGDYITVITNPDHQRHYRRQQLIELFSAHFDTVEVFYAVRGGRFYLWGLSSWSLRYPFRTILSAFGNVMTSRRSARPSVREEELGTQHLFAVSRKHANQ
jgi:SAM-dependent methyltransferase